MDFLWETVKGLGALVGLATGGFVLWDRFYRMTPTAVVVVRPMSSTSVVNSPYLQIRNPADRPILVRWQNGIPRGRFGLAADGSTKSIVVSLMEGESTVVIDSGETREFRLLKPNDAEDIDPENTIEADLYWRYAQPKLWKRDRRIRVSIPKRSMMHLDPEDYAPPTDDA